LARLGIAGSTGGDHRIDVARAIAAVEGHGLDDLDTLCCGNVGRIELLLTAADELGRPELRQQAHGWASTLVGRATEDGYQLSTDLPRGVVNPGLFRGLAGIGYLMLRLAQGAGGELPCVLLWR
jgi:lantibiotic modifying enzyme